METLSTLIAPPPSFEIEIKADSVEVRLNTSKKSPHRRFYAGAFYLLFLILIESGMIFGHGKNGSSSMAEDLMSPTAGFGLYLFVGCLLAGMNAWLSIIIKRSILGFFPADQTLHCDGTSLLISNVRWFDTSNSQWISRSFLIREITQMGFGVMAHDRYRSIQCLRFKANGKTFRVLPGLSNQRAKRILTGLQSLGVDLEESRRFAKQRNH